jgi:hypothetical protein
MYGRQDDGNQHGERYEAARHAMATGRLGRRGAAARFALPGERAVDAFDYVFMAVLFGLVGGAFEIVVRSSSSLPTGWAPPPPW